MIFWLSHKENQSDNQVKLTLDRRRVGVGQKLELTVTARDAKGEPLTDVTYRDQGRARRRRARPARAGRDLYTQGEEARARTPPPASPATTRSPSIARKNGQEIGRDSARFLVYQDDRELENPAADLALAPADRRDHRRRVRPPESLRQVPQGLDQSAYTEYVSPTEHRIWDNWPFFLIFTALLTLEWWLRKRHGWV